MSQSDVPASDRLADHAIAIIGFLVALALAAVIWRLGPPGLIPTHWGANGQVNGWEDRSHLALIVAAMTAGAALLYAGLGLLSGGERRNLKAARLILVLMAVMTAALMTSAAFGLLTGPGHGPSRLLPAAVAGLMLVLGAFVGKSSPNPFVGVRTYWSLRSRLSWDKSNRLCGRLFLAIGVLGLIASVIVPPGLAMLAILAAVAVSSVATIIESWRVWKNDPDRLQP